VASGFRARPRPSLFALSFWIISVLLAGTARAVVDPASIVVYDLVPQLGADFNQPQVLRRHYDEVMLVTCLQAIVNRAEPRLFVRYNSAPDDFWFEKMRAPGAWMENRRVIRISKLSELLSAFGDQAKGLVLWDSNVPATSNVAASIAGIEDLLAVRYDPTEGSVYRELTDGPKSLKIIRRLVASDGSALFTGRGTIPDTQLRSTGSAKNDAYRWFLERFIKPGKANPRVLGYYIDADWLRSWRNGRINLHTLNNLDYVLAHRGIVLDLDVWEDEAPVDDPSQTPGTDVETFKQILRACYDATGGKAMIACHGFVPWAFKYTNFKTAEFNAGGRHGGVDTEWHMVELLSSYNVYVDADAIGYSSMVNASFYQHFPLPKVIKQTTPPPDAGQLIQDGVLDEKGRPLPVNYYANFQGDYDSAAWVYWQVPKMWNDPARGTLPLTWAMNPTLADRFAFGMAYMRQTARPKETWVADEGAGYLMPANLSAPRPSGLSDGLQIWADHCQRYYQQWDLHVTGFNIDGNTPVLSEKTFAAYRRFSSGGIGLQKPEPGGAKAGVIADIPFITSDGDLPGGEDEANIDAAVDVIVQNFKESPASSPAFHLFRSILRRPSFYAAIEHRLDQRPGIPAHKLVDLPTLLWLIDENQKTVPLKQK
jgi:hypothetical protein